MKFLHLLPLALSLSAPFAGAVHAQDKFPSRAVNLIIPQPPGGSTDFSGRVLADGLSRHWGVQVRAINVPGGNTVPAVTQMETSRPDGHTVLLDGGSSSSMLPIVMPDQKHDLSKRTFLAMFAESPMIFVVSGKSKINSLADLVSVVKANPENFSWITNGGTGVGDLAFGQLFEAAEVRASVTRPVAASGGSPAAAQVAGGHVMAAAGSLSSIAGFLQSGDLRAIAVLGQSRLASLPDVPTAAEAGHDIIAVQWGAVSGPANMPPEVIKEWQKAISAVQADKATVERLQNGGIAMLSGGTSAVSERVTAETSVMQRIFGRKD